MVELNIWQQATIRIYLYHHTTVAPSLVIYRVIENHPPFLLHDYSASKQCVENKWQFVAFTYDGEHIKSCFLNGKFGKSIPRTNHNTKGFYIPKE
jgi:hypothetical protein